MSEQAKRLARRFEQANGQLMALVEQCSHDEWRTTAVDDERAVGVVAHHLASSYSVQSDLLGAMAAGQEVPAVDWDMVHQMNAEHAEQHPDPTRDETLDLLRRNGQAMVRRIRGLDDAQLGDMWALPFLGDRPVSTQQFIEQAVIDHIDTHRHSMAAAIDEQG